MSRLTEIPIRVEPLANTEPPAASGGLGGGVAAILSELVSLLERLADGQSPASIDLRSLPMSPQDRAELQQVLGEGEVQATCNAQGLTKMRETRVAGVWWVEHFDPAGALIAELLEVCRMPDILLCAPDEIAAGARALRAQISGVGATFRGGNHAAH